MTDWDCDFRLPEGLLGWEDGPEQLGLTSEDIIRREVREGGAPSH